MAAEERNALSNREEALRESVVSYQRQESSQRQSIRASEILSTRECDHRAGRIRLPTTMTALEIREEEQSQRDACDSAERSAT